MRVLTWGLGYVGNVVAACLADDGHDVVVIEPQKAKVDALNDGRSPIKEPGLDELVERNVSAGRLRAATHGVELVAESECSLICVGTPSAPDGGPVLDYLDAASEDIAEGLAASSNYHVVVVRSTVFPGTARGRVLPLLEQRSGKRAGTDFGLATNPEFLRESTAVKDFVHPPYTIVGQLDERSGEVVTELYGGVSAPLHRVSLEDAEMLKMTSNAFHALKVTFANEIGRVAASLSMDSHVVMDLLCADTSLNISSAYLRPGFAFGGSCLPKDVRSLVFHAAQRGVRAPVLDAILPSNALQVEAVRAWAHSNKVKRAAILGLSFKPYTDDLRESPVIELIHALWRDGIDVAVFDPDVVSDEVLGSNRRYLEQYLPQAPTVLKRCVAEATTGADTLIVAQDRPEFAAAAASAPDDVRVLDLVRVNGLDVSSPSYSGLSW